VAVSPNGRYLAAGDSAGTVHLWDLRQVADSRHAPPGKPLPLRLVRQWRGHEGRVYSMLFDSDGDRLITAGSDGAVKSWSIANTAASYLITSDLRSLGHLDFASATRLVALDEDNGVVSWDLTAEAIHQQFTPLPYSADYLRAASKSSVLALFKPPGELTLQSLTTGEELGRCDVGDYVDLRNLCLSPDGKLVAALIAAPHRQLRVFDTTTGAHRATLDLGDGTIGQFAFAPDGRQSALNLDSDLLLWSLDGAPPRRISRIHEPSVRHLAYSSSGTLLASAGSDRLVHLWDPRSGEKVATLAGHRDTVESLVFSPDGRSLVTASFDGTLKVWHTASGEELFDLHHLPGGFRELTLSPDGRWLAARTNHTSQVLLFDLGELPIPPMPVSGSSPLPTYLRVKVARDGFQ
jgi:WD40 repeat protein